MLREQHVLAMPWTGSFKPAVMRTNMLPLEPLLSSAAASIPLPEAPISWTRRHGAAVCQLMLAALLALPPSGILRTVGEQAPTQLSTIQIVAAQQPGGELVSAKPSYEGFAPHTSHVAGLQQTIDEQSEHIKMLEGAIEALRAFVCIVCGIVVVII